MDSPEAGPGAGRRGNLLLSSAQLGQLGLVQFGDLTPWSAGKCSCFLDHSLTVVVRSLVYLADCA